MKKNYINKKINRRNFIKNCITYSLGSLLLTAGGYSYARFIEPKNLSINNHELHSFKIPQSFDGTRIVLFSDTHLGHYYSINEFTKLINIINEQAPDIILFTGDLIDAPNKYKDINKIAPLLKQLRAPLGKYSIYGNHDHGGYGSEIIRDIMRESDFKLLINEHEKLFNKRNDYIFISGLDDAMLGNPDIDKTLLGVELQTFTILLAHQPDIIKELGNYPIDVQLSGHSHGGQVQLPFYGPIFTPIGATTYYEGFYKVGPIELYVNRGIGTTRVPFRFLSPPELTIFTLKTG
ncbi:metallophosphoesterase [Calidifontibacillus oryziterrae]|uniref:metallophosphoesterase n=1 Tax=Calidifontibacillus oryziterrae TaxID=1191699 RepID=UPI000301A2C2|nr:metallophosphoesterase [Calidifontibacillus oryziterrae]